MPYKSIQDAEAKNPGLKKYSDKAKRGWIGSFNECMADGGPEDKCFAIAYSVANKVDGRKPKKSSEMKTAREYEDLILQAVAEKTSRKMAYIIMPWIRAPLIGNHFIVADMKNIKFKYVDNDNMSFSAKVYLVFPDSGKESWKTYRWNMKGRKYRGRISSDMGEADIVRELLKAASDLEAAERVGISFRDEARAAKMKAYVNEFFGDVKKFKGRLNEFLRKLPDMVENPRSLGAFPELEDIIELSQFMNRNVMRGVMLSPGELGDRMMQVVTVDAR